MVEALAISWRSLNASGGAWWRRQVAWRGGGWRGGVGGGEPGGATEGEEDSPALARPLSCCVFPAATRCTPRWIFISRFSVQLN